MTNLAWGLAPEWIDDKLNPAETRPVPPASSGCALGDDACDPFWPGCCPYTVFLEFGRPLLGRKGAPHSSQYCDPSRFSVLHLSQVII